VGGPRVELRNGEGLGPAVAPVRDRRAELSQRHRGDAGSPQQRRRAAQAFDLIGGKAEHSKQQAQLRCVRRFPDHQAFRSTLIARQCQAPQELVVRKDTFAGTNRSAPDLHLQRPFHQGARRRLLDPLGRGDEGRPRGVAGKQPVYAQPDRELSKERQDP